MGKRSIDQKLRLWNFDARQGRIETGALVTNRRGQRGVERGREECYQWRAKGQSSRGDSCSFRHDENKRAKSTPKSAPPSEPPKEKDGRSKSRRKSLRGRSPSGKFARQPCREYTSKVSAREHLVIICILPKVNSTKLNRDANSAKSVRLRTGKLKINQQKNEEGWWQKCSGCIERFTAVGLRISGHGAAWIFIDFTEEHRSPGTDSTCAILKTCAASRKHPKKAKVHRSEWLKSKILISEVPTLWNLRVGLTKRLRDKSDVPAETRGDSPEVS